MISKNKTFLLLFCLFFLFANFSFAFATNGIPEDDSGKIEFIPQIGIPGSEFKAGTKVPISGSSFIDYMSAIYTWSVRAIAIIAIIMIMIAGFQWMTAAGNASAIGQAKSRISSSLIGLLLAIGAYSLLNFVNPSLVNLRTLGLGDDIERIDLNISKKTCNSDGHIIYEWNNHHCFGIPHDDFSEQFFPVSDFVNYSSLQSNFKYSNLVVDIGISALYRERCNVSENFKGFFYGQRRISCNNVQSFTFPGGWSAWAYTWGLASTVNSSINPEENFYGYIKDNVAGIMVKAECDASDSLTGIRVWVANKTAGEASAFIKNIEVSSDESCIICCKTSDRSSPPHPYEYESGFQCGMGEDYQVALDYCDAYFQGLDLINCSLLVTNKNICDIFEKRLGICQWNSVTKICDNKIPN